MAVESSSQNCLLADVRGSGPPLVILHGLFASGSNMRAVANDLAQSYTVYSVDLPSHGKSIRVKADSVEAMARSVKAFLHDNLIAEPVVIGHSLGGKVAMSAVLSGLQSRALVVLDIAPVAYAPSHQAVFSAIEQVAETALMSRQAVRDCLAKTLTDKMTIDFLTTQLHKGVDGRFGWKFDWQALRDNYGALLAAPAANDVSETPSLFIAGELSSYIDREGRAAIKSLFSNSRVVTLKGTGHWPHAQKFEELMGVLHYFLRPFGFDR